MYSRGDLRMKSKKSKVFGNLKTQMFSEPKALKEIHDIREHLSKLPEEEIEERLADIRHRYKQLLVS